MGAPRSAEVELQLSRAAFVFPASGMVAVNGSRGISSWRGWLWIVPVGNGQGEAVTSSQ